MYGQPDSSLYFSSNTVGTEGGAMAQRKGILTAQVVAVVVVVIVMGALMGGRIFLTNQITGLRTRVADLENQREFLEAGSARLHLQWNEASSRETIVTRASTELGLIVPESPGLVLVCVRKPQKGHAVWDALWEGFPARERTSQLVANAMISLEPRSARAGTIEGEGQ